MIVKTRKRKLGVITSTIEQFVCIHQTIDTTILINW